LHQSVQLILCLRQQGRKKAGTRHTQAGVSASSTKRNVQPQKEGRPLL
jgi:hypothetical protein